MLIVIPTTPAPEPPKEPTPMMAETLSVEEQAEALEAKQWNDLENARDITYDIKIYPYGWCTYFVSTKRNIPNGWGNAGNWYWNAARSLYYEVGQDPAVGAIMVSWESWWCHVALVTDVRDCEFDVAEMNYKGWGIESTRTIKKGSRFIAGFIY